MIKTIVRVPHLNVVGVCPRKNVPQAPKRIVKTRQIQTKVAWNDPAIPYFVGKSVILFTFFYTSLQWMHYRRLRELAEKEDDDE